MKEFHANKNSDKSKDSNKKSDGKSNDSADKAEAPTMPRASFCSPVVKFFSGGSRAYDSDQSF